jgi:2-polyprenyl-6-methoxyphenol hydroxylase-like FAD-dependent oxidoreductase
MSDYRPGRSSGLQDGAGRRISLSSCVDGSRPLPGGTPERHSARNRHSDRDVPDSRRTAPSRDGSNRRTDSDDEVGVADPGGSGRDAAPVDPDGTRDSSGRGAGPLSRGGFAPERVPTDDVVGGYPDRQVVVIGGTIVGRTLALLLRHAGYDPVLVAGTEPVVESRVTFLWPAAVRVFEQVGVDPERGDWSTTVDGVCTRRSDDARESRGVRSGAGGPERDPLVVGTRALRAALERQCSGGVRSEDRAVETLTRADDGLAVRFDDGIEEWFDLAVDARRGDRARQSDGDDPREYHPLRQYEAVDAGARADDRIRDEWHSKSLVQRVPRPAEPGVVVRVTTPTAGRPATLADERAGEPGPDSGSGRSPALGPAVAGDDPALGTATSGEDPALGTTVAGSEPTVVRQTKLPVPPGAGTWWGTDRVAFCGPAAYPVAPATGCRAAFGVEDALAFVTELTREASSPSAFVERYRARRARRFATRCRRAAVARSERAVPGPDTERTPLDTLEALRTVALASSFDTSPERDLDTSTDSGRETADR